LKEVLVLVFSIGKVGSVRLLSSIVP